MENRLELTLNISNIPKELIIANNKKNSIKSDVEDKHVVSAADFETAVSATGFGTFNILLLMCGLPCAFCSVFDTSSMSYILPGASCDLELTLYDKGILNAITYIGMICSAVLWGFLADTLGRRKLLIFGYLIDGLCDLFCSFSQSMWILLILKFTGGFIICGPFAVLVSYLSEFHCMKYRSLVIIAVGIYFSLANIALPALAWLVIPQDWQLIIQENLVLHSWQFFLAFCSLPSLVSGCLIWMLPESPKFLMARGRNIEAMKVFKKVFVLNTGKSADEFPIKALVDETAMNGEEGKEKARGLMAILKGFKQMKPMFQKPLLFNGALIHTVQFLALLGLNTMRLWLPQLFTILEEYSKAQNGTGNDNLCTMLSTVIHKEELVNATDINAPCTVLVEGEMYMNSIIVGLVTLVGYLIAGSLISAIGSKNLLIYCFLVTGFTGVALYWAKDKLYTLILSSLYVAIAGIGTTAILGVIVNLFPTSMRTMVISLSMMFGRTGAIIGNVIFPVLLENGCLPPFILVGSSLIVSGLLCIALPKTNKIPLQ